VVPWQIHAFLETVRIAWGQLERRRGYSFPIPRLCKGIWRVNDSTRWSDSPTRSALHEIRSIHPDVPPYADDGYGVGSADGVETSRVSSIEWPVLAQRAWPDNRE